MSQWKYPHSPRNALVEELHGTPVADPYRWLEDPNDPQTQNWIEAQNQLTQSFLQPIAARQRLLNRLTELWDYPKATAPFKKGGRYFSSHNSGLQNQYALYVQDSLSNPPQLLLDPNALSDDGTVALNSYAVSPNGHYLAYAVSSSGSDWQTWRVRHVDSSQDLADQVEWSKFCVAAWLPDSSGFFYSRYDAPTQEQSYTGANYHQKVYLHRLGTPQQQDELIYERPDQKEWGFQAHVTHDGMYLVLSVWQGTFRENLLFYRPLNQTGPFTELISRFDYEMNFVGHHQGRFLLHTNWQAPNKQVIAINLEQPNHWQTVVAPTPHTLQSAQLAGDGLALVYLHHAHHRLHLATLNGQPTGQVELPAMGALFGLNSEAGDPELFFGFTSFLFPTSTYLHHLERQQTQALFSPPLTFDPQHYQTQQVFVQSRDGTPVPLFLVHKKGLELNGQNPTLLYGYGGFNIPMTPAFHPGRLVWLEQGGVFAQACLRGGGEYGHPWHQAGTLGRKQNVFDDFIACAEWLIEQGYTQPSKLAIEGRSNGGLLVGACMTQRPELFGAALPGVGVLDMLRFHRFTIGWAWVSDYGSPDNPEHFKFLLAYSPYHNLKPGTAYPATLITTADHDDRVVPAHSFKFAAALQAAHSGPAPMLIRIDSKAGHGAGKPTAKLIEEQADVYAFLTEVLKVQVS